MKTSDKSKRTRQQKPKQPHPRTFIRQPKPGDTRPALSAGEYGDDLMGQYVSELNSAWLNEALHTNGGLVSQERVIADLQALRARYRAEYKATLVEDVTRWAGGLHGERLLALHDKAEGLATEQMHADRPSEAAA